MATRDAPRGAGARQSSPEARPTREQARAARDEGRTDAQRDAAAAYREECRGRPRAPGRGGVASARQIEDEAKPETAKPGGARGREGYYKRRAWVAKKQRRAERDAMGETPVEQAQREKEVRLPV